MTGALLSILALILFVAAIPFLIVGGALLWLVTHIEDDD